MGETKGEMKVSWLGKKCEHRKWRENLLEKAEIKVSWLGKKC